MFWEICKNMIIKTNKWKIHLVSTSLNKHSKLDEVKQKIVRMWMCHTAAAAEKWQNATLHNTQNKGSSSGASVWSTYRNRDCVRQTVNKLRLYGIVCVRQDGNKIISTSTSYKWICVCASFVRWMVEFFFLLYQVPLWNGTTFGFSAFLSPVS